MNKTQGEEEESVLNTQMVKATAILLSLVMKHGTFINEINGSISYFLPLFFQPRLSIYQSRMRENNSYL